MNINKKRQAGLAIDFACCAGVKAAKSAKACKEPQGCEDCEKFAECHEYLYCALSFAEKHIVAQACGGTILIYETPQKFATEEEAREEARRLCKTSNGKSWEVEKYADGFAVFYVHSRQRRYKTIEKLFNSAKDAEKFAEWLNFLGASPEIAFDLPPREYERFIKLLEEVKDL